MATFLRRRLQVFVSSTYTDLIQERQAAVEAILTAGHIPAGMELFTAGDQSQMDVIQEWIDESDVFLLILAGRYGSLEPITQKSYIQLEYEYAVQQEKPLFACVIREAALDARVREQGASALETQNAGKLAAFRELVLSRMVRFWVDSKDINISIGQTLAHFSRRDDLVGWVRPQHEVDMPALADEITRLSRENATLREELLRRQQTSEICGLSFTEMKELLEKEGLLDFLTRTAGRFARGAVSRGEDGTIGEQTRLCRIGLIREDQDSGWMHLTEAGRTFINRLDTRSGAG